MGGSGTGALPGRDAQVNKSRCNRLVDVFIVAGFTFDNTTQTDDGIHVFIGKKPICPCNQFVAARHMDNGNAFFSGSVTDECFNTSLP